jgi:hypothetical protein
VSASFSNSGGSVSFRSGPLYPDGDLSTPQALPESAGAERVGCDYYYVDSLIDLPIRMTAAELASFLTFWRSYARGMAVAFTYTDVLGVAISAKFAVPTLPQIIEAGYNLYTTTVSLRVQ